MSYNFSTILNHYYGTKAAKNRLAKFWAKFCQDHDVDITIFDEQGNDLQYWMSTESFTNQIDESYLVNYLLQPQYDKLEPGDTYPNAGNEWVTTVTLGDLVAAFENEECYKLRQFEITPTRVSRIADNIVQSHRLLEPIELCYVRDTSSDFSYDDFGIINPVLLSGRHRACSLLAIFSKIEGWEDLQLFVKVRAFESEAEMAAHVQSRNGSRTMSGSEADALWFAQFGTDPNDPDDIFQHVKSGIVQLPKVFSSYFLNVVDNEKLGITAHTCGLLGRKIASRLKEKGVLDSKVKKFLKVPEVAKKIADTAVNAISNENNWAVLRERCKKEETDNNGNTVVTYNISRSIGLIANIIAQSLANQFEQELNEKLAESEAKNAAKLRKNKEAAADRERKRLENIVATLKNAGIALTEENINKLKSTVSA